MDTEDGRWTRAELQVRIVSLVQTVVLSGPVYTKRQCQRCKNSAMTLEDTVLIENNGVTQKWVATPI